VCGVVEGAWREAIGRVIVKPRGLASTPSG
jgi:hypothetical protein